jgi:hypothetical protein
MKASLCLLRVLGVAVFVASLTALVVAVAPVSAVAVSAVPASRLSAWPAVSNLTPRVGQQIVVTVWVDTGSELLGSYTGQLNWDPAVLRYDSNTGAPEGFVSVVNAKNAGSGRIVFAGANVNGVAGRIVPIIVTFTALKRGSSVLDLNFTAMAAAQTFGDLLPRLRVRDGAVAVWR